MGFNFTQPIALRVDELISGVKSQVAVKIFGEDLGILKTKAEEIAKILSGTKGTADLRVEQVSGQPYLHIEFDRPALARYGINIADVQEIIETAIGGSKATELFEGDKRFAVPARLPQEKRNNIEAIGNLLVPMPEGRGIPLSQVANLYSVEGPNQVSREYGQRRVVIECNVRGRDIGGFVREAQEKIGAQVSLPPGYTIGWGGQFKTAASDEPINDYHPYYLSLIFLLLYLAFNSLKNALLIILNVPFGLVGGIIALFISGQYLSVPASVGFIALFGIAVLNGIVLVSYFNQLRREGVSLDEVVIKGTEQRYRPVLMTAMVTMFRLIHCFSQAGQGLKYRGRLPS